ncbi:MAG: thioredoxin family protein [Parabacteroides sp.]|nr:thioredoxin family protein [Parabacteroides sp.]
MDSKDSEMQKKINSGKLTLVEFFATWCIYCQRMQPIMEKFEKEMEGKLQIVQVDIDKYEQLASDFDIEGTPTFILMENGEQLWREAGEMSLEQLKDAVKEFIGQPAGAE